MISRFGRTLHIVETTRAGTPVGVAVAGLGAIGRLHARHLAGHVPHARLVRVADSAPSAGSGVSRELGVPWSASYDAALEDPSVSAVVIATPTPLHAAMVERAAAAGRHVFCEKPLSLDEAAGARAVARVAAAARCLQVGFQRRFDPDWVAAKQLADAGDLGEIQLFRVTHRNQRPPHGAGGANRLGSLFVDMSIHDLDSARWLVGEVSTITAYATARCDTGFAGTGDVDSAVLVLRFRNGALGVIDNTRVAGYGFDCGLELMGRRSTVRTGSAQRRVDVEQLTASGMLVPLPVDHVQRHRSAYLAEMTHFIASIRSETAPVVGGDDALAALCLARAAEQSWREERPVQIPGSG